MFTPKASSTLTPHTTDIPGLLLFDLDVRGDNRGWFKENWQRQKMADFGLPDFGPVQNNISFNAKRGTMRGIHAEPWDKFISVGAGSFFGAWVDIRTDSPTYGKVVTATIDPGKAIFVPTGVANSYLTLEENTVYSYLVNDYWQPNANYTFLSAVDPALNIQWPIPPSEWEWSDKDKQHPNLAEITPMKPKKILVTGADGQVGRALRQVLPDAKFVTRAEFDITDPAAYQNRRWYDYQAIINAAAYNAVDKAEQDRQTAWEVNARAVAKLAQTALAHNLTLVHFGSDYEFDGSLNPHLDDEPQTPIGVYAQSKAAGVIAASTVPKHYILRVEWVIGDGHNFVRTMQQLAQKSIKPKVVADQIGRLTFADTIAQAVAHLLTAKPVYGIYNLSNEGPVSSWADIAREVYKAAGKSASDVEDTTTADYFVNKPNIAPRPLQSVFSLDKIKASGFTPPDWRTMLETYLKKEV